MKSVPESYSFAGGSVCGFRSGGWGRFGDFESDAGFSETELESEVGEGGYGGLFAFGGGRLGGADASPAASSPASRCA